MIAATTLRKCVSFVLIGSLASHAAYSGGASSAQSATATNIRFTMIERKVVITYDLAGEPGERYTIGILLKKESDASRSYRPRLVTGAVGEGVVPGKDREIVWDLYREIPSGLEGADYYFVVSVESESGGFPWWTSAALVGAGIIGLLVFAGGGDDPKQTTLPPPPGRP